MNHRANDTSHLAALPAVNALLQAPEVGELVDGHGRDAVVGWVRQSIEALRSKLENGATPPERDALRQRAIDCVQRLATDVARRKFGRVINATGVVLHTGLGRAPMSAGVADALAAAVGAANVELDVVTNERRTRGHQLLAAWQSLTGCEDALVVNNNAAATLLALQALCAGGEVVISRGQLIEIGGSFRLPEIFTLSGAKLKEVGTTNRTTVADYKDAIGPETAAIMRVHPSNYRVTGFAETPDTAELAALARRHNLTMIDDIGSGSLLDMTDLGLPAEPTFTASLAAGADVVLGSGDKLLGGPQAGIILGRSRHIEGMRTHPMARAMRIGKLTLAALSATLDAYRQGNAEQSLPVIRLLTTSVHELEQRARRLREQLKDIAGVETAVLKETAAVGGGSLPGAELPTRVLAISHTDLSTEALALKLRTGIPRIIPRIKDDLVLIDLRSVLPEDDELLLSGLRRVVVDG